MKKLILLLLIPILSYTQNYNELIMIDSLDDFKKVMIENKYEFISLNCIFQGEKLGEKYGNYYKDGSWKIQFNEKNTLIFKLGDYDDIVEEIKKCDYVGIEKFYKNNDYVTYNCNRDINGKIGFMIVDGNGFIRYFRNKK